jgi:predicted ATPase
VSEAVMQAILAHAEGNPFFLEELARGVIEQGASHRMILPETLQAVLASRIDRLPPQSKRLLQRAAVIGKDIPVPLLEAVAGISNAELERELTHLRATELLFETMCCATRTVSFKHALIRETAYQSLLRSTRQEYHHRTAQVLEEHFAETADTQPELLAHHYTEAGLSVQAIPYWQRAGQRAVERSAQLEAVQHLTTGLALLATLPDTPTRAQQELDLHLALGPTLMATKGFAAPEVEQTYARARALCAQVGDTPQLLPTLRGLWRFYHTRGALPTARELADQLSRLAQRTAAPTHLLEAHGALGATLFHLGDYATARTHLDQGIALIDPPAQRALALRHGEAAGV